MAGIDDIVLRTTTHAPLFTKGIDIDYVEEDNNFIVIYEAIKAIGNPGSLTPYDSGTTYDPAASPIYVSYNGNAWFYVGVIPTIGVTPGTDPTVWQLTSTGTLTHQQNTDLYLNFGGANQISAAQLKGIFGTLYILTNRAAAITSRNASQLRPGYKYVILDGPCIIEAQGLNSFKRTGLGFFFNCDYQNVSGQNLGKWKASLTPLVNQYCIWQDVQYKNLTGANSGTPPNADFVNWVVLTRSTLNTYIQEIDLVVYDIDLGAFIARADKRGNYVGKDDNQIYIDFDPAGNFQFGNDNVNGNTVEDGYLQCLGNEGIISRNKVWGNSCVIADGNSGEITQNNFRNGSGEAFVWNLFFDAGKSMKKCDIGYDFPVYMYPNQDYIAKTFTDRINSFEGILDLSVQPLPNVFIENYGTQLVSGLASATIEKIDGMREGYTFTYKPDAGTALTFKHRASPNPHYMFIRGGVDVVIDGAIGNWIQFIMINNEITEVMRGQ